MNLASPTHFTGHDEIAAILGTEILSGARPPGSRMPGVSEMFARFGISRVMMREVMKTLAAKGMIAAKSRVGTHVLAPSHWNWFDPQVLAWRVRLGLDKPFLNQLAEMRRAVEPAGAALAAGNRTPEHLRDLRSAIDAMAGAGDSRAFAEADLALHIAVSAASGNPLFRSFAGVVESALVASFALSSPVDRADMAIIVARHAAIVDAIEADDGPGAAAAMLAVIDEGLARVSEARS